jgi:FAD/FMN-containing dehydrogenase
MNLTLAIKNGGYSLALFSTINNGVVLDLSLMNKVVSHDVNNEQATITYQGGCTFGSVNAYIKTNLKGYTWVSGRAVGIGAIGSHGLIGDGPTSKMIGFGVDQIVKAKVVLSNG